MSERFVVRWPHQGDARCPDVDADDLEQWLEDTADGSNCWNHGNSQPEDMCLGRDLDAFVGRLNSVDDERLAAVQRAEKAEAEVASLRRDVADLRAALAEAGVVLHDIKEHHRRSDCADWAEQGLIALRLALARTAPKGPEQ